MFECVPLHAADGLLESESFCGVNGLVFSQIYAPLMFFLSEWAFVTLCLSCLSTDTVVCLTVKRFHRGSKHRVLWETLKSISMFCLWLKSQAKQMSLLLTKRVGQCFLTVRLSITDSPSGKECNCIIMWWGCSGVERQTKCLRDTVRTINKQHWVYTWSPDQGGRSVILKWYWSGPGGFWGIRIKGQTGFPLWNSSCEQSHCNLSQSLWWTAASACDRQPSLVILDWGLLAHRDLRPHRTPMKTTMKALYAKFALVESKQQFYINDMIYGDI